MATGSFFGTVPVGTVPLLAPRRRRAAGFPPVPVRATGISIEQR
jgi:hypothetical protein